MKRALSLLAILAISFPSVAQGPNPCEGRANDGPAIQAAVNASAVVNFDPATLLCVDARVGVRIPSGRLLRLNGATLGILPGCVGACKMFETVPGSADVRIENGTLYGDLAPAIGFSIGIRGDSVTGFELDRVTLRSWRTDGVWLGGNLGTHQARLTNVTVEDFGRNGVSIVNGSGFVVDRFTGRRALPGANPGAGIDVEPNPGDRVQDLTIRASLVEDAVVGYYLHAGRGYQGYGFRLLTSEARNCSRYGVILNSTRHAFLIDNRVYATTPAGVDRNAPFELGWPYKGKLEHDAVVIPVGISIGATGPLTADDVWVSGNLVEGTSRRYILAGVVEPKISGGPITTVAPSATVPATAGVQFYIP